MTSVGSTDDKEAVSTTGSGCFLPSFTFFLTKFSSYINLNSKKNRPTHIWLANSLHMFRQLPSLRRHALLPPDDAAAADDDAFAFAKSVKRELIKEWR